MQFDYPTAFTSWDLAEGEAIARVIRSGQFTMGPEVEAFEEEFAAYHSMKHCVMVNSGSSANLIAIAALFHKTDNPLKRGDKAVVPALAWATTYAPLVQYGLDLVLADCDVSWNANPYTVTREAQNARLVVAASILGNPADLHTMQKTDAYFIEDNCESFGAVTTDGHLCGTFGLMNTFSFYHSHQLSAIEGGAILTNDDECATLCRMLRNHGWTKGVVSPASFADEYRFEMMGYNIRPVEMHAAIAREQLKKADKFAEARRKNYDTFHSLVSLGYSAPPTANPFGLAFLCPSYEKREELAKALRSNGIDCRPAVGGSFRKQPYGAPWADQKTPNADLIHDCGMMIGNAPFDISDKIEKAVKVMRSVL